MSGHGHVFPNENGMKARCGGPGLCAECAHDLARQNLITEQMTTQAVKQTTTMVMGDMVARHVAASRKLIDSRIGFIEADRVIVQLAGELEAQKEITLAAIERAETAETRATNAEEIIKLYDSAWLRALGGQIYNKSHRIDGLAYTTKDFREKALKWEERERVMNLPETLKLAEEQERADKRAEWLGRVMQEMEGPIWETLGLDPNHLTLNDAIDAKLNEATDGR